MTLAPGWRLELHSSDLGKVANEGTITERA